MKNFTNSLKVFIPIGLILIVLFSCEDDKSEPDKAFVGKWQTEIFSSYDLLTGAPVEQQMHITLTNTTFENKIVQRDSGSVAELKFKSAIKGKITDATDKDMNIEITQLSITEGVFFNKETDLETFNSAWTASLGKMLYEEFEAKYSIDGEKMELIIPIKYGTIETTDTLKLTKN